MSEYYKKPEDIRYYKWNEKEYIKCNEKVKRNHNSIEKESINKVISIPNKNFYDNTKIKSTEKNSLVEFINNNFKGINITIYTKSSQTINGEVVFNYDNIIVLKTENQIYYINPKEVTYFF